MIFNVILSNRADALEKLIKSGVRANWYILEYIDKGDDEIEELLTQFQLQKREYLMCQLVGGKIYKVVAAKGET